MEERKRKFVKDVEAARNQGTLSQFYEKYADTYDDIMSTTGYSDIQQHSAALLMQFITTKQPLILDVGCGTGYSGLFLQKAGFQQMHGTDPSPSSLRESEKKGVYSKLFHGLITETEKLNCADGMYDGLFCIGTITKRHLELKPALCEFQRVVKSGGFVVFTIRNDKLDQKDMMASMGEVMHDQTMELISMEKRSYFVDAFCLCCVFKVL